MHLVQNTLSRFVSEGQIAGCSARIMKDDEVRFEGCFGYANLEKKTPISDQTIFPIASMSKVITVVGLMQLYEQGLFKLWDPVSSYLPGFKTRTSPWKSRTAPCESCPQRVRSPCASSSP